MYRTSVENITNRNNNKKQASNKFKTQIANRYKLLRNIVTYLRKIQTLRSVEKTLKLKKKTN